MKNCREREYRRTFPEAGEMAKQGRCPTNPASKGKSNSQLNAIGQPSNSPTKPASRGNSALQLNVNKQLSNGATKVPREEQSASEPSENVQLPNELEGVEPNRRAQSRRDSDNHRRNQRDANFAARRNEYLHNRGWADPGNLGLHHEEWAQEEMAAFHRFEENLRHYHCVVCKEAWPLSAARLEDSYTCSRCQRDK